MRKFFLLATFFTSAPCVFALVLIFFLFITYHDSYQGTMTLGGKRKVAFAALPSNQSIYAGSPVPADAKVELVRQFLAKYNSPLEPYAEYLVEKAQEYGLDFRLLPAIAMQESNLCKKNRPESHNCWGFGIYGGKYTYFDSYPHAIDTVAKTLSLKYKNKHGLVTPEEIQKMYTPSNDGSWAYSVNLFMEKMQ